MTNCCGRDPNADKTAANPVDGLKNPYLEASEYGWQIDPSGLRYVMNEMYDRYQLPLMIVENGLGAKDTLDGDAVHDPYRIEYLREHIKAMSEAMEDGVEVLGYMPWSAIFGSQKAGRPSKGGLRRVISRFGKKYYLF